jgi:hypothetical protein
VDEEPARGGVGERDAHVEHARSSGREGDGDGGAGAELDLALAVDRDGAALHGDPVRDAGGQVPGVADADRGDDARRDRGEDRPVRGGGIGEGDDDTVGIGPRGGVQQAGDAGQADRVRLGERAIELAQGRGLPVPWSRRG